MSSARSRSAWHRDRKHVQAIEEILAEHPAGHGGVHITIRGSDDADVDADRLSPPDALKFAFLQHPQQCHLGVGRQLTHFIEEDRAAVGELEPAEPALEGSCEGPLS
jgi:hypothetical protein